MIQFKREKNVVEVRIEAMLSETVEYIFNHDCSDEQYAELLRRYFEMKLQEATRLLRKHAYIQGYEDGRWHGKRKREFCTGLNRPDMVGY